MIRRKKSRKARVLSKFPYLIAGGALGILGAYFFDPDRGRSRRARMKDQAGGKARKMARGAEDLDEVGLARKVESLLFSDPSIPKGRISINAEAGVVYLRGTCDTPDQINRLEEEARKVAGVAEVRNMLHLKGTRAPL